MQFVLMHQCVFNSNNHNNTEDNDDGQVPSASHVLCVRNYTSQQSWDMNHWGSLVASNRTLTEVSWKIKLYSGLQGKDLLKSGILGQKNQEDEEGGKEDTNATPIDGSPIDSFM